MTNYILGVISGVVLLIILMRWAVSDEGHQSSGKPCRYHYFGSSSFKCEVCGWEGWFKTKDKS